MGTVICMVTEPTRNPRVQILAVPLNLSTALKEWDPAAQSETAVPALKSSQSHIIPQTCKHSGAKYRYSAWDRECQKQTAEAGVRFLV